MNEMYREKQIWREYLMRFRVLDFIYIRYQLHCYSWVPWTGKLLCTSPFLTSDCDTTDFTQASTLSFTASLLESGPHTPVSCAWFLWASGIGQCGSSLVLTQHTQKHKPAVGGNASHLLPLTEVCRSSRQEQAPISLLIMQPSVAFLSFSSSISLVPPFCFLESQPK